MNGDPVSFWFSDSIAWIKPIGEGTEVNSTEMKLFIREMVKQGHHHFVLDAGECTGMDQVFMGTLLGTALRLRELKRGKVQVVRCPADLDAQLRHLGLDQLLEISADDSFGK